MINKHKLCKMALVSAAVILMLVNITGARSFHYDDRNWGCGDVILKTNPVTQSVDFLKFPACGCDGGCGDVILKTNPVTQSVDFLKFPACGYDGGYGFPI